jgi:hypothetical protein
MCQRFTIALLGAALLRPVAEAQVRGGFMGAPARTGVASGMGRGFGVAFSGQPGFRRLHPPVLLGAPYFYSDYSSDPAAVQAPPQVVVVQVPSPTATPQEARAEPLLIEWQGDRYVRMGGTEATAGRESRGPLDYAAAPAKLTTRAKLSQPAPARAPELPAAVVVYRDGRREAIRDYTIIDGTIYARGDYWTDGYWNKKIQLAGLDLPATLKASQNNGVRFVLPTSPNEVITRP